MRKIFVIKTLLIDKEEMVDEKVFVIKILGND
jgi:hypothetical protein